MKHGPGPVESRALDLNSTDAGDDTASQGGSESDTSRTEGKGTRSGTPKKPASFKPISFAKFSVPKAPGSTLAPKPTEKGILLLPARIYAFASI